MNTEPKRQSPPRHYKSGRARALPRMTAESRAGYLVPAQDAVTALDALTRCWGVTGGERKR